MLSVVEYSHTRAIRTEETTSIIVLAANTTTKIFVSQESDLEDVLRMVRKVAKPGVPEYFGSCEYSEVVNARGIVTL